MGMDSSPPWAMFISSIDHQFVAFAQKEIDAGKKTAIARLDVDATPGGHTSKRAPPPPPRQRGDDRSRRPLTHRLRSDRALAQD